MDSNRQGISPVLLKPLEQLEALGLRRPLCFTVGQFVEMLVAEGLLSRSGAARYIDIFQETRFSGKQVSAQRQAAAADGVSLEIESLKGNKAARLEEVARRIAEMQTSDGEEPAASLREAEAMGKPDLVIGAKKQKTEETPAKKPVPFAKPSKKLGVAMLAIVLVACSAVAFWLGYRFQPRVERLMRDVETWMHGEEPSPPSNKVDNRLEILRQRVENNRSDLDAWLMLADFANQTRRYAVAVWAYRHLIANKPDDATAYNNLAWQYCTAEDPLFRDPVQALALAKKAYELDKAPHVADTLAEAAYQNGDFERAIALEEDALDRTGWESGGFYLKQLEKFKAALEKRKVLTKSENR